VAEALPERLLARAVQARSVALGVLPGVEQRAQLLARRLPLDARGVGRRELLGRLDDRGAGGERGGLGGGALLLELRATRGRHGAQRLDAGPQAVEVSDCCRLGDLVAQLGEGRVDLLGGELGGAEACLEERDLGLEVEEATDVEGDRLVRGDSGELAHGALSGSLGHVDRAVLLDAAEGEGRLRLRALVRDGRRDGLGSGARCRRGLRAGDRTRHRAGDRARRGTARCGSRCRAVLDAGCRLGVRRCGLCGLCGRRLGLGGLGLGGLGLSVGRRVLRCLGRAGLLGRCGGSLGSLGLRQGRRSLSVVGCRDSVRDGIRGVVGALAHGTALLG
jgi:hypothetical protein